MIDKSSVLMAVCCCALFGCNRRSNDGSFAEWTSSQVFFEMRHTHGYEVTGGPDADYSIPTKAWFLNNVVETFVAPGAFSTPKNDCDDFARAFCEHARAVARRTKCRGSFACGEFWTRGLGEGHTVVWALVGDPIDVRLFLIDPQTKLEYTINRDWICVLATL